MKNLKARSKPTPAGTQPPLLPLPLPPLPLLPVPWDGVPPFKAELVVPLPAETEPDLALSRDAVFDVLIGLFEPTAARDWSRVPDLRRDAMPGCADVREPPSSWSCCTGRPCTGIVLKLSLMF